MNHNKTNLNYYITKNGKLNESIFWHKVNKKIYWVDILDKKIKSFDPDTNNIEVFYTDKNPCCIQPLIIENEIQTDKLLCAMNDGIGTFDIENNSFEYDIKINDKNVRFNDGKIDKNGILYIGTMDINEKSKIGNIYKYENNELTIIEKNIGITNGIAFNDNFMYFSDSLTGILYKKNLLTNENIIINQYLDEAPDGGCFYNNKYYSCIWGGNRIDIYEDDKIIDEIKLENKYITCCDFNDNNELFITCFFES